MLAFGEPESYPQNAARVATLLARPVVNAAITRLRSAITPSVQGGPDHQLARPCARAWFQQRKWNDKPQMVANVDNVKDHIAQALDATSDPLPPFDLEHTPADLRAAVDFAASYFGRPKELAKERARRFKAILQCKTECASTRAELDELQPGHIKRMPQPHMDAPLGAALSRLIGWPDCIASDFTLGFKQCGHIPHTGVHTPKRKLGKPLSDLQTASNNRQVLEKVTQKGSNPANAEATRAVWDSTMKELEKGLAYGESFLATDHSGGQARIAYRGLTYKELTTKFGGPNGVHLVERFPVTQGSGDAKKCRPCDNYCSNLLNEHTSQSETISCIGPDFIAKVACLFAEKLGPEQSWSPRCFTEDISAAYKRCPGRAPCFSTVALWDPDRNHVAFVVVPGLNFGMVASVTQFNRVPALCTAIARRCLGIPCGAYFDDYACCEPNECGSSAQFYLRELHKAMGIPLACGPLREGWACKSCGQDMKPAQLRCTKCSKPHADIKSSPYAASNIFLGVETSFRAFAESGEIRMRVPTEKVAQMAFSVAQALSNREFSTLEAQQLRGKLQFLLSWSFGRLGRAALQPLSDRQHTAGEFTAALEAALLFFQHILKSVPACAILAYSKRRVRKRPVLVWSDAAYEISSDDPGTLGFVIFVPTEPSKDNPTPAADDGQFFHASAVASDAVLTRFAPKGQQIGQLELLAAVCVYYSAPGLFRDRDVIHWIDNSSAIMGLIKGYSSKPDSARIVHAFYLLMFKLRTRVWFEHVVSDANVSDMPSRGDVSYLTEALSSNEIALYIPPFEAWDQPFDYVTWDSITHPTTSRKRGR